PEQSGSKRGGAGDAVQRCDVAAAVPSERRCLTGGAKLRGCASSKNRDVSALGGIPRCARNDNQKQGRRMQLLTKAHGVRPFRMAMLPLRLGGTPIKHAIAGPGAVLILTLMFSVPCN